MRSRTELERPAARGLHKNYPISGSARADAAAPIWGLSHGRYDCCLGLSKQSRALSSCGKASCGRRRSSDCLYFSVRHAAPARRLARTRRHSSQLSWILVAVKEKQAAGIILELQDPTEHLSPQSRKTTAGGDDSCSTRESFVNAAVQVKPRLRLIDPRQETPRGKVVCLRTLT